MPTENRRSGLRLGLGTATVFVVGLVLGWPLATIAAVFTGLFLQGASPLPVGAGLKLVALGFALMAAAWAVFSALDPYPVPFLIALLLAVAASFRWAVRGGGMLPVLLALMAALMVPFLVRTSADLAALLVLWIPVNMAIAVLVAQFWFVVLPDTKAAGTEDAAQPDEDLPPPFDEGRRLVRMTVVTLPFAATFFVLEAGALLTLLFVAIMTQQLAASTAAGPKVAAGVLFANVVGGVAAIIAYELVVVAPFFPFMALVTTAMCLSMGVWFASDRSDAALAGSALTTALILFGGTMAPFGDEADVKMLSRLVQVGAALAYVLSAFLLLDTLLPERTAARKPG